MSCLQTISDYGLRAIGIGERLLPREDFTLCQQFTLIGSGMIWNVYFGVFALVSGFCLATLVAVGKNSAAPLARKTAEWLSFCFGDRRCSSSSFLPISFFCSSSRATAFLILSRPHG